MIDRTVRTGPLSFCQPLFLLHDSSHDPPLPNRTLVGNGYNLTHVMVNLRFCGSNQITKVQSPVISWSHNKGKAFFALPCRTYSPWLDRCLGKSVASTATAPTGSSPTSGCGPRETPPTSMAGSGRSSGRTARETTNSARGKFQDLLHLFR